MSYDIAFGVKVDTGNDEKLFVEFAEPEISSPTYNLSKIFKQSTGWDFVQGKWYRYVDVEPLILHGIEELTSNPDKYKALEPSNGWGTVGIAVCTLQGLVRDARGHGDEWGSERWPYVPVEHIYVKW